MPRQSEFQATRLEAVQTLELGGKNKVHQQDGNKRITTSSSSICRLEKKLPEKLFPNPRCPQ